MNLFYCIENNGKDLRILYENQYGIQFVTVVRFGNAATLKLKLCISLPVKLVKRSKILRL